jgi:hypothetical protein
MKNEIEKMVKRMIVQRRPTKEYKGRPRKMCYLLNDDTFSFEHQFFFRFFDRIDFGF